MDANGPPTVSATLMHRTKSQGQCRQSWGPPGTLSVGAWWEESCFLGFGLPLAATNFSQTA